MSDGPHTLEEVAERTGIPLKAVREAVEKGNLALAQNASHEDPRVTGVELERWHESVKRKPTDDRSPIAEGD